MTETRRISWRIIFAHIKPCVHKIYIGSTCLDLFRDVSRDISVRFVRQDIRAFRVEDGQDLQPQFVDTNRYNV